jgi:hypothetical protein
MVDLLSLVNINDSLSHAAVGCIAVGNILSETYIGRY